MRNRNLYPTNWDKISYNIRISAGWKCEFCGKPCRPAGVPMVSTADWLLNNFPEWLSHLYEEIYDEELGAVQVEKPHRFTLTTAHLDHNPSNCDVGNLKALCAPCHCKYDASHHANSRKKNLFRRLEENGQLSLDFGL